MIRTSFSHPITKCKASLQRFFYSERTHNLLNYLTLDIEDAEIK